MPAFSSRLATARAWVDPESLPVYLDAAEISGNVPQRIKQLVLNTLGAYGVGSSDCFAHIVGRRIRIAEMHFQKRGEKTEVVVTAEVQACREMLNGAGTVHGGCLCYLIDNCASFPLVALGLMQDINGVGVSQAMNVFFHAPAAIYMYAHNEHIRYPWPTYHDVSVRVSQVTDKQSGRLIASALLSKMQPTSPAAAHL